jgi:hypothetical protein
MLTPYQINEQSVTVHTKEDGLQTFAKDSEKGKQLLEFIKADDDDGLLNYLNSFKATVEKAYGQSAGFVVKNGVVFVGDDALPHALSQRILNFAKEGLPFQPLLKFWERLNNNPSNRAVERLFEHLNVHHHPLMPDGRFVAYKRVSHDFKDIYSGKFDNSIGAKPSVPRNKVDEDITHECSHGLHVASWDYAKNRYSRSPNDHMVSTAVDPADVVMIPRDENGEKMRVCTYEVLEEVNAEKKVELDQYPNRIKTCPDCGCPNENCECDEADICEDCGQELSNCDCYECPDCRDDPCSCLDDDYDELDEDESEDY